MKSNPLFTQVKTDAIDTGISKLLQKGVMKCSNREERDFISLTLVTPKTDGGYKLILNLKSLNDYIEIEHFKIHGLEKILKLVMN